MKRMTTIIIDDEDDSRQTLGNFLKKYCPEVMLAGEAGSVKEALTLIGQVQPDIVFLDINMPQENGLELFHYLPSPDFFVVFVTAYDEYAIKAIKHHALDYILKPVNIDELIHTVNRAVKLHETKHFTQQVQAMLQSFQKQKAPEKIALPVMDGLVYVPVQEIIRCEAEGNYTMFYFSGRHKMLVSRTLGSYELTLKPMGFVRVHHQHLINLHHVEKYQRGRGGVVIMSDKKEVIVSQRKKDEFLKMISSIDPELTDL